MLNNYPFRRILAFCLNYIVGFLYAMLLFFVTTRIIQPHTSNWGPFQGQMVGFFSLTLPVVLYFSILEFNKQGSVGKMMMKLKVLRGDGEPQEFKALLMRNILKFLPWEVAHFGVHWAFYYVGQGMDLPIWNWSILILAQACTLFYLLEIFFRKDKRSLYDRLTNCKVV